MQVFDRVEMHSLLVEAMRQLGYALDLFERTQCAKAKEGSENPDQVRDGEDGQRDWVAESLQQCGKKGGGDVGVGEGTAAHPADEGTPAGYEKVGVLRLSLVDGELPEDLLEFPAGLKLGKFKLCISGYCWVREYPVYQLTKDGEKGEEGHSS